MMMTTKLNITDVVPLGRRVVIKLHKRGEKSDSGLLYIPDTAGANTTVQTIGTVVHVSPAIDFNESENNEHASTLCAGDIVVFGKFNGMEIKVGKDEMVVVSYSEIVAKLIVQEGASAPQS